MADPRAFISFDFDHNETSRILFVGQAKNSKTPFCIEDWSSKSALDEDDWEDKIGQKIGCCHLLIVLVGKTMASANGVARSRTIAWNWESIADAITQMMGEGKNNR